MRRRLAAILIAGLVLTGTAACGDSESSKDKDSSSSEIKGLTVTGDFGKEPEVKVDNLTVTKTVTAVLIEGDGDKVEAEDRVKLKAAFYRGKDGELLSSTYSEPTVQTLVLKGSAPYLADSLTGETYGSRVAVALKASEILGPQGDPQSQVKPEDPVVVVVDLLEKAPEPLSGPEGEEQTPPEDAPKVIADGEKVTGLDFTGLPKQAPKTYRQITLIEGEGEPVAENDNVTVNYYGAVWGESKAFDSSYDRGEPASFGLTKGGLIDGWVKGLDGVPVGSRVMLILPPDLAYGAKGSPPNIPGNSTLVFVIDVLGSDS